MFKKQEEKQVSSKGTLKKEVNVDVLNHPLERTMDPTSLSMTYTEFRNSSLGISFRHLLGNVNCSLREQLGPRKKNPTVIIPVTCRYS